MRIGFLTYGRLAAPDRRHPVRPAAGGRAVRPGGTRSRSSRCPAGRGRRACWTIFSRGRAARCSRPTRSGAGCVVSPVPPAPEPAPGGPRPGAGGGPGPPGAEQPIAPGRRPLPGPVGGTGLPALGHGLHFQQPRHPPKSVRPSRTGGPRDGGPARGRPAPSAPRARADRRPPPPGRCACSSSATCRRSRACSPCCKASPSCPRTSGASRWWAASPSTAAMPAGWWSGRTAHGLGDRVRFRGVLTGEALRSAYRESDVFAMPFADEGFGIAALGSHGVRSARDRFTDRRRAGVRAPRGGRVSGRTGRSRRGAPRHHASAPRSQAAGGHGGGGAALVPRATDLGREHADRLRVPRARTHPARTPERVPAAEQVRARETGPHDVRGVAPRQRQAGSGAGCRRSWRRPFS